jgi:hypothetical protein
MSRWRAFGFAAGLAAVVLGLGAGLTWLTRGGFWFNTVTANVNGFQWSTVGYWARIVLAQMPGLVLAGAAYVVVGLRYRLRSAGIIIPYLVGAVLVTLTIGKVGASYNYLLELCVALSLTVGGLLSWLRSRPAPHRVVAALLAVQALALLPPSDVHLNTIRQIADRQQAEALMQVVRKAGGQVLADEATGLLPLLGRRIQLQPFEMTELSRAGVWDQGPLVTAIEEQRFTAVLIFYVPSQPIEYERWSDEMRAALARSYVVSTRIGSTAVYQPRR